MSQPEAPRKARPARIVPAHVIDDVHEYLAPVATRLEEQALYNQRHGFTADAARNAADATIVRNIIEALTTAPEEK